MSSVTLDAVIQKFEILPESAKKEVADFIDFLLLRRFSKKKKTDKKMLLEISQWTEEDIKAIEDAGKEINKWQLETY